MVLALDLASAELSLEKRLVLVMGLEMEWEKPLGFPRSNLPGKDLGLERRWHMPEMRKFAWLVSQLAMNPMS